MRSRSAWRSRCSSAAWTPTASSAASGTSGRSSPASSIRIIASLLDGGSTPDGRPYFAMEYVEGQPIVDYCDTRRLDTAARLKLFRHVCAAVQYAHQNLIIHRDIKPANVLVIADGAPKLLDFGIAKLLNPELAGQTLAPTAPGLQLMTPEYASPEQVRGEPVTTATDVYSLGVLLYELLAGRLPYRLTSRAPADIVRIVCESEPMRPSTAITTIDPQPARRCRHASAHHSDVHGGVEGGPPDDGRHRSAAPSACRRSRQHHPQGAEQGAAAPVCLGRSVLRGRAPAPRRPAGHRAEGHVGLPDDQVRAAQSRRRGRGCRVRSRCSSPASSARRGRRGRPRLARAGAEQRFGDVRQLANAFLFDFHDSIADLEGSTPARKLIVTKGLEYLDRLAQRRGRSRRSSPRGRGGVPQGRRRPGPSVHAQPRRHGRRPRELSQGRRALRIDWR